MIEPNRDSPQPIPRAETTGSPVQDRALRPPGVLPKNTQTYIIIGIAALMVGAIAFSGAGTPQRNAANAAPKAATAVDPNWARIQDYRNRIDEQARKLADEQAKLEQAKQAFGLAPVGPAQAQMAPPPGYPYAAYQQTEPHREPKPEKSAIEADKEKREYQSLFASNVALSYRKEEHDPVAATTVVAPTAFPLVAPSLTPSAGAAPAVSAPLTRARVEPEPEDHESLGSDATRTPDRKPKKMLPDINQATGKQYRLLEGSIIETVLTNRLNGSFSGPVNCMVTTDVYSHDRQQLLIPQGSRVLGEAKRNDSFGQQRIAVFFHRIIMPDGFSLDLDQFHGLSQIGETGLRDQVNHHYGQVFGISLAVGAIAGLATINTNAGLSTSGLDAYRQGVATNLSQSSLRILDKYLNVLPTFTIREGHRIKVILSDDLELPAYARHKMPGDM